MLKFKTITNSNFIKQRRYEAIVFIILFFAVFGYLGSVMGVSHMVKTIMETSYDLLMKTVLSLMAIMVVTSALGNLFVEFGVVRLLELILAPLMRPLFNLPGVSALAGLLTFLSDNPAIISLANDKNFSSYFKKYQLVSLTNFGTAFGMGLIVITFMGARTSATGESYFNAALVGLAGAVVGSIISTRLMQFFVKRSLPDAHEMVSVKKASSEEHISLKSDGGLFLRFLNSILDGGKSGVKLGVAIIPGVLIISTMVMMLTFGPKDPSVGYQGLPYEGVPILPKLADHIGWFFKYLFGFEDTRLIAFPITALGAVGAALSLVETFIKENLINGNAIAVFTAMGMCWSGYFSTHCAMLDTLGYRQLTSKALISHTIGGLIAGCFAHYLYIILY